jgi:hypothetical protein
MLDKLYCHTKPDPRLLVSNSADHIQVGKWYYYHRYKNFVYYFIDLKEDNDKYSRTILCFSDIVRDKFFWTLEDWREKQINQILNEESNLCSGI